MELNRHSSFTLIFLLVTILTSCTQIPYDEVVIPAFKKTHPSAKVSQIFPIGGHGTESYTGGATDIVIHFSEGGDSLEEIWTATRTGGDWDVRFKCKSAGNVCIEEKGQGADESVAVARGPETGPEQYEQVDPRELNCALNFLFHESAVSDGVSKPLRGKTLFNRVQPKKGRFREFHFQNAGPKRLPHLTLHLP